jgi:hypothetical protein
MADINPLVARASVITTGSTRTTGGEVEIWSSERWLKYPRVAHDLMEFATQRGWGCDDGLPPIGGLVRKDGNGVPYIRILIGRERGWNANTGEMDPAVQFHLTWVAKTASWDTRNGYMKTDVSEWENVTVNGAREIIMKSPVNKAPHAETSQYANTIGY